MRPRPAWRRGARPARRDGRAFPDRAHRIGRQRKVQVRRFITRGTFEQRINETMRSKRELAEMTVDSGETWVAQLPAHELKASFELR
jgi:SNF2 family DNA or RNA helicase